MITKKAKYALKALIHLADQYEGGKAVQLRQICAAEALPHKFLELIMIELRNAGIVESRLGKAGGYRLAQAPQEINMARILRVVEGPIAPLPCVSLNFYEPCSDCEDEVRCRLRRMLAQIRDANLAVMEKMSLKDMIERPY